MWSNNTDRIGNASSSHRHRRYLCCCFSVVIASDYAMVGRQQRSRRRTGWTREAPRKLKCKDNRNSLLRLFWLGYSNVRKTMEHAMTIFYSVTEFIDSLTLECGCFRPFSTASMVTLYIPAMPSRVQMPWIDLLKSKHTP